MSRIFWFRKMEVGTFNGNEMPPLPGRYSYRPFQCQGHQELRKTLQLEGNPICYYYTGDNRVLFRVRGCPADGFLEIDNFEMEPWPVPGILAQQFSGIFRELVEQRLFSEIAKVSLTEAGASGTAIRLVIWQCDIEVLALVGISRRWWVVDGTGMRPDGEWPLTDEMLNSEHGSDENPSINFATDGQRVRFGMLLGRPRGCRNHLWYAVREAPLGPDGRFMGEELKEIVSYYA